MRLRGRESPRTLRAAAAALSLLALAGPACAWTEHTQQRVAENAARLMPESLRTILAIHKERLLEGARSPRTPHGDGDHFQNLDTGSGSLVAAVETQSRKVLRMLNARSPMGEVVYEMGVLSHLVADAQNPLNTSSREPREADYAEDFEVYVERKLDRFPLVFYGYHSEPLAADDYRGFARGALERASRHYDWLVKDYVREGEVVTSAGFSDFSFAFGAGALAYSHAVCDTSSVWLHLWRSANGDCTDLPMKEAPVRIPGREP
jgi:hypothetical protein